MIEGLRGFPGVSSVVANGDGVLLDVLHDASMAPIVAWLVGRGAEIEEVRREAATLEDVYLALMQEGA